MAKNNIYGLKWAPRAIADSLYRVMAHKFLHYGSCGDDSDSDDNNGLYNAVSCETRSEC